MAIELRPLTEGSAKSVASWFSADPAGNDVFGDFYGGHPRWWTLVRADYARWGWTAADRDGDVGFIDLEIDNNVGHISLYVVAPRRRAGLGRKLLNELAGLASAWCLIALEAAIDPSNDASLRCLSAAGFTHAGSNEH